MEFYTGQNSRWGHWCDRWGSGEQFFHLLLTFGVVIKKVVSLMMSVWMRGGIIHNLKPVWGRENAVTASRSQASFEQGTSLVNAWLLKGSRHLYSTALALRMLKCGQRWEFWILQWDITPWIWRIVSAWNKVRCRYICVFVDSTEPVKQRWVLKMLFLYCF